MLKNIILSLIVGTIIWGLSCKEESLHRVRIVNDYSTAISNFKIDNTLIGTIPAGSNSGYRFVEKGGHLYNGQIIYSYWGYTSTTDIEGYFNILGEGDHNWTIRFDSNLNITFKEN